MCNPIMDIYNKIISYFIKTVKLCFESCHIFCKNTLKKKENLTIYIITGNKGGTTMTITHTSYDLNTGE